MNDDSRKKNPIVWLPGKYSYTAIISKEIVNEHFGEDITDVSLEVTDSGLLIKKKDVKTDK